MGSEQMALLRMATGPGGQVSITTKASRQYCGEGAFVSSGVGKTVSELLDLTFH